MFGGRADIGHGSKISVAGSLELGAGFGINAESSIVCRKRIVFGRDCLLSWDVLIMDTDFHRINSAQGEQVNADREVLFGDKVWIGCRSTVLKGVTVADGVIIGAGSHLVSSVTEANCALGGNPAKVIGSALFWE
jgi:acetyltransferase-like isoleucine patch superfamily enzyme